MMRKASRTVSAIGALLSLSAMSFVSPAAAQEYQAQRVVPAVTLDDMQSVVRSLGHAVTEVDAKTVVLVAEEKNGLSYVLEGTACDVRGGPGCQGIKMQVLYTLTPEVTNERLAAANLNFAAVSLWVEAESDTLGVTRYVVLDDGVTMANIRANVSVLLSIAPIAADAAAGGQSEADAI